MQVGDKVYCKKTMIHNNPNYPNYYKGRYYTIRLSDYQYIWFDNCIHGMPIRTFNNFFYTLKDYRKMKLLKLNEIRKLDGKI